MDEGKSEKLSHVDEKGKPGMVDVSHKQITHRKATASCKVILGTKIMGELESGEIMSRKGPVFQTAIIAGTLAVKKTAELIPFCHPLNIEKIDLSVETNETTAFVRCTVSLPGKTGVEMEAITGVSIAAVTIYDMCKAMSHDIIITDIQLEQKSGGKSDYRRTT